MVATSRGPPLIVVDEKTDFREIARDGGTVVSYRDFIFREVDTAGFMYIVDRQKASGQ